jgi:hypothetical protein
MLRAFNPSTSPYRNLGLNSWTSSSARFEATLDINPLSVADTSSSTDILAIITDGGYVDDGVISLKNCNSDPEFANYLLCEVTTKGWEVGNAFGSNAKNNCLVNFMVKHSILIQLPIVLSNNIAAIGRPPENVLEILR